MAKKAQKIKRKKKKLFQYYIVDGRGQAHIKSTYNNTIISIADVYGNVISWCSAGKAGFSGPKQSTPYAAQQVVKIAAEDAKAKGVKSVDVFVKGPGAGRESAIRALEANGIKVLSIKDVTPVPHNGTRRPRPRRV